MSFIFEKYGIPLSGDGGRGSNPETTVVGYILIPHNETLNVSASTSLITGLKAQTHAVILNDNMSFEDTSEDDVIVDGIAGAKFYIRDGRLSEILTLSSNSGVLKEIKKLKRTTRFDVIKIDASGGLIGSELLDDDTEDASTYMRGLACELSAGRLKQADDSNPKSLSLSILYKDNYQLNENYLYAIPNYTMLDLTSIAKVNLSLVGSDVAVLLDDGVLHGDGNELKIGGLAAYFMEGGVLATGITWDADEGNYTGFTSEAVVTLDLASQTETDMYVAENSVTIP